MQVRVLLCRQGVSEALAPFSVEAPPGSIFCFLLTCDHSLDFTAWGTETALGVGESSASATIPSGSGAPPEVVLLRK